MDISKVKLVIWDLDETFWKGTLSEGTVQQIPENIEVIKQLVNRGIMNSIVSKNDMQKVDDVLTSWGIRDLFVFPKVSWNPKGEIVKKLLEEMKLRPANTVFVDDNPSNLAEVEFYNKGVCAVSPDKIKFFLDHPAFEGKSDSNHLRLSQYHLMEKRSAAESSFTTNEDFLRSSHIRIQICDDCLQEEDRILELIERTNQLNYTKNRLTREQLHDLLLDNTYENRYVKVVDDFGEYGITGFYSLRENILIHFLFSCRTLGFGVENYIYQRLDHPHINIVGEVATPLDATKCIDWIAEVSEINKYRKPSISSISRILMVAGCDLEQATVYLSDHCDIDKEFTTVVNGFEVRSSDTCSLVNTIKLDEQTKKELDENLPFIDSNVTYGTKIYSGNYDTIIISLVDDYIRGMYRHKKDGYYIGLGGYYDQDYFRSLYSEKVLKYLDDNFDFVGKEKEDVFRENIDFILSRISDKTKVILINGVDLDISEWLPFERIERNRTMNAIIDECVAKYDNVSLLDMRSIVKDKSMLIKQDNRHFSRKVYFEMAKKIVSIVNTEDKKNFSLYSRICVDTKAWIADFFNRILYKIKRHKL